MHEFYCSPIWYTSKDGELIMTGPQVFVTQLWISFSHRYGSFELKTEKNMVPAHSFYVLFLEFLSTTVDNKQDWKLNLRQQLKGGNGGQGVTEVFWKKSEAKA